MSYIPTFDEFFASRFGPNPNQAFTQPDVIQQQQLMYSRQFPMAAWNLGIGPNAPARTDADIQYALAHGETNFPTSMLGAQPQVGAIPGQPPLPQPAPTPQPTQPQGDLGFKTAPTYDMLAGGAGGAGVTNTGPMSADVFGGASPGAQPAYSPQGSSPIMSSYANPSPAMPNDQFFNQWQPGMSQMQHIAGKGFSK